MIGSVITWVILATICGFLSYCSCWNYKMNITVVSRLIMDTPWNATRGTAALFNTIIFFIAAVLCLIKVAVILGFVEVAF